MNKKPLKKIEIFKLLKKISIGKLKSEKIRLLNAQGRILSSDIRSTINLPPFNNSAVDGYALHKKNLKKNQTLKCTKRIVAGDHKRIFLKNNELARIFTGARMPQNSLTVVMQENVIKQNCDYISIKKVPIELEFLWFEILSYNFFISLAIASGCSKS